MVLLILYLHVHTTVNLIKLYDRAILMALRNQPPEAYELLDQRDEAQILAEIKGQIIDEMFYSFSMDGREVTGISWVGTKEIARQYGGIDMNFVRCEDTPISYIAIVKATDTRRGTSLLGTALQNKMMSTRAGEVEDRFAFTKAVSKAQRNAIRAIIPEKYLLEMYKLFKEGGKTEPVTRKTITAEVVKKEDRVKAVDNAKPVEKPKWDPDEQTVITTLEVHGLPVKDLSISKYGIGTKNVVVRVEPQEGFPQEMFKEYDKVLKLVHAKWLALENRWEVPDSGKQ